MKSFLYHILRGLIIDEYRKKKTISLEELAKKGFEPSEDNSEKIMNILDGEQAIFLISQLPIKYQKIIKMRYLQELSLEEISGITGISKKTLSVQIHRGLKKLRGIYNKNH
jgi:RNA polymerase sigma-70 factor, ECF subfamily